MTLLSPRSLMLLVLMWCLVGCTDSGSSGWFIISNPSGNGLTAGVVKNGGSSAMSQVEAPGGSAAFLLHEDLGNEVREQYYAVGSDLVVEIQTNRIVVESPAFTGGRRSFPAGLEMSLGLDSATLIRLDRREAGKSQETWWLSGWGNLLIQKTLVGITVFQEGKPPVAFGAGASLQPIGKSYEVVDAMGHQRLFQPAPPPSPQQRMAYVEARQAVQFFDANGRVVAELPAKGIEMAPKGQSFFLTGKYPQGLPGISHRPISVLIPRYNRHLILLTH